MLRSLGTYNIAVVVALMVTIMPSYAQTEKDLIRSGNKEYAAGKFKEAEDSYRAAIDLNTNSMEGSFNLGDAAYKQKNYDDAINQFELLSKKVGTPEQVAQSYHNLGNSYLRKKEYEKSIDAYKQALRNNPKDMDTRYNLAYAQAKLKQQQEQQQEEKKDKDKNENEEKKDEEKKDKEKKDEEKKDEEKKNEEQKKDEKKDGENKEQKPKPDQLSKEEARKILEALKNKEMNVQDKLQKKKLKATKVKVDKDW